MRAFLLGLPGRSGAIGVRLNEHLEHRDAMPVPLLRKPGLEGIVQSDRATGMAGHRTGSSLRTLMARR
jgi:hypothetical protein